MEYASVIMNIIPGQFTWKKFCYIKPGTWELFCSHYAARLSWLTYTGSVKWGFVGLAAEEELSMSGPHCYGVC